MILGSWIMDIGSWTSDLKFMIRDLTNRKSLSFPNRAVCVAHG